jgi:ATP-dependent DNA ligase
MVIRISIGRINNAMSDIITQPLLAGKLPSVDKASFPCLATPKVDGIRAIRGKTGMLTRQKKPIPNKVINDLLSELLPEGADGEICVAGNFQGTTSAVMSASATDHVGTVFYFFDYVKDDPAKPYVQRLEDMKDYLRDNPHVTVHPVVKVLPLFPVQMNSPSELLEYEVDVLKDGFEGVMIRKPEGPYKMGRSTAREGILLKLKQFEDAEAVVVGVCELNHNQNEKERNELGKGKRSSKKAGLVGGDTLGSLLLKNDVCSFSVGSGFTDDQRKALWAEKDSLLGKVVKYRFQPVGVKTAPRFPTFLGFRDPSDM